MKAYSILTLVFFTCFNKMNAQTTNNIAGTYYLHGVMETGSGIKLNEDSSFEFFYSYGALDRYGSGKWSIQNNSVVLNSRPYPGSDFKMLASGTDNNKFTTVKIEEKNPAFFTFVYCMVRTKNGDTLLRSDSHGYIKVPGKTIDTIHLLFKLCPEKVSTFTLDIAKHNVFTFGFEPWIVEVFFKDFNLQFVTDHLEGKHPLLGEKVYQYLRE